MSFDDDSRIESDGQEWAARDQSMNNLIYARDNIFGTKLTLTACKM